MKQMNKITDEMLATLIEGLKEYKAKGVVDPWLLDTGETIEPLDVLEELKEYRMEAGYLQAELTATEEAHKDNLESLREQLDDANELLKEIKSLTR